MFAVYAIGLFVLYHLSKLLVSALREINDSTAASGRTPGKYYYRDSYGIYHDCVYNNNPSDYSYINQYVYKDSNNSTRLCTVEPDLSPAIDAVESREPLLAGVGAAYLILFCVFLGIGIFW